MDFFAHQDAAQRKTWLLIVYFGLAVLLMTAAVYFLALITIGSLGDGGIPRRWFVPQLALIVSGSMTALIGLASAWKTLELHSGGEKVALLFGGQRINSNTRDLAERRLLNIVEEMALAAGLPVPPVFVLSGEPGINAFAAGHSPADAVIAVSRGALQYLTRDELQGVVAHEFSHILRGDMRLNLRLIGVLFGILVLSICGYYLFRVMASSGTRRSSSDNKKEGGGAIAMLLFGLGLWLIGSIGLFFGRLIKAAISRQREFMADASAVQFTRNPDGIAGALKKIGGLAAGSKIESPEAENASHMFFANGVQSWFSSGLETHPPLADRIRRIEPQFTGQFPKLVQEVPATEDDVRAKPKPTPSPLPVLTPGHRHVIDPVAVLATVGSISAPHLAQARDTVDSLPAELVAAAKEPFTARAIVACLLLSSEAAVREKQAAIIAEQLGQPVLDEALKLDPLITQLGTAQRMPLVDLAQPALKSLSSEQYAAFRQCIESLIRADDSLSLFEFILQRTLLAQLDRHYGVAPPPPVRYRSWPPLRDHAACVLSALCYVGHDSEEAARSALVAAWQPLAPALGDVQAVAHQACTLSAIGAALDELASAAPALKKQFLAAAMTAVSEDGTITVTEAELLRAIASSLDCPLPPVVSPANHL